jgi:hypothetical protein
MPRVHLVASLLKRWLIGTHQGGVQHQHLDYYLDEFTFRFNRRRSKVRGLLFHRLAEQAVAIDPAPYRTITGKPMVPSASVSQGQKGIPIWCKSLRFRWLDSDSHHVQTGMTLSASREHRQGSARQASVGGQASMPIAIPSSHPAGRR